MMRNLSERDVLVHLASGVGNIIFATPLFLVLSRNGYIIDLLIHADYPETAELFSGWSAIRRVYNGSRSEHPNREYSAVVPAIPPFYWNRFVASYRGVRNAVIRPADDLFYSNEQDYYLEFARQLACDIRQPPYYFLPFAPVFSDVALTTVVLAPGCKTGDMASKRWPYFALLAERFEDVVLVGTADDLYQADGTAMCFPSHVRSLIGRLSLLETASILASAGVVVANDSGLGHMAGAIGVPTILLFGPTPHQTLGRLPPNVTILRTAMACEPCWFSHRFGACGRQFTCLKRLSVEIVGATVAEKLFSSVSEAGSF